MRSKFVLFLVALLISLGSAGTASAILFVEQFDKNFDVLEGYRAIYNFDLTASGGTAVLRNADGLPVNQEFAPALDETGFEPLDYVVNSALLSFEIGGLDGGEFAPDENIRIRVTGEADTGINLFSEVVSLGVSTFDFALDPLWLGDGILRTVAVALALNNDGIPAGENDFRIRYANLTVDASPAPVPEPSTVLLLGVGLAGLFGFQRRRQKA